MHIEQSHFYTVRIISVLSLLFNWIPANWYLGIEGKINVVVFL